MIWKARRAVLRQKSVTAFSWDWLALVGIYEQNVLSLSSCHSPQLSAASQICLECRGHNVTLVFCKILNSNQAFKINHLPTESKCSYLHRCYVFIWLPQVFMWPEYSYWYLLLKRRKVMLLYCFSQYLMWGRWNYPPCPLISPLLSASGSWKTERKKNIHSILNHLFIS